MSETMEVTVLLTFLKDSRLHCAALRRLRLPRNIISKRSHIPKHPIHLPVRKQVPTQSLQEKGVHCVILREGGFVSMLGIIQKRHKKLLQRISMKVSTRLTNPSIDIQSPKC